MATINRAVIFKQMLFLWLYCIEGFVGFQFEENLLCESLTAFLTCQSSNDHVVVKKATYGRTLPYPKVCGDLTGRPPCKADVTATVLPYCFQYQNCTFPNKDSFFGQPCSIAQQGKYLVFDKACVPEGDVYPVCGDTAYSPQVALPLPEEGLLAPPFFSRRKQRPWRCDVRISGAASVSLEVINDDNGRIPIMACGRNIFIGDLRASPGCRPLSKDENYITWGDINLYFYNSNDTGPQALIYYQVMQKDVLSILTASRQVHPVFEAEPSTVFPPLTEGPSTTTTVTTTLAIQTTTANDNESTTTMVVDKYNLTTSAEEVIDDSNSTFINDTPVDSDNVTSDYNNVNCNITGNITDSEGNITCIDGIDVTPSFNSSSTQTVNVDVTASESNTATPGMPEKDLTTAGLFNILTTTVASNNEKTEPPKITSGNKIPDNASKSTQTDNMVGSIPAYLVGIIVGVLGFIILLLIIAFIVAVCKRKERHTQQDDMTALSQDREKSSREMNIYSTIDLHEQNSSDAKANGTSTARSAKSSRSYGENTIQKTKSNSTFNPSEIWYEDKVDFALY